MSKPITIIGGGLAGLALGCYLRKNKIPVTLIEAGKYPRHKVCGEFICGVEDATLEELGILDLFDDAESVRNIQWYISNKKILDKPLPLAGTGISRYLLDDRLHQRFQDLGGVIKYQRIDKTQFLKEPSENTIWACGKEKHGKGSDKLRWLGIKMHVTNLETKGLEMHTGDKSVKGGYLGLSPVENGKVNICGLFEVNKELKGKGSEKLRSYLVSLGLTQLVKRLDKATIVEDSFSAVAGFSLGHQNLLADEHQDLFPVGDAALVIPPFTGNGMSMAIEGALIAGQTILPYCKGETDSDWSTTVKSYLARLDTKFGTRLFSARAIHPFFFHPIGRTTLSILANLKLIPFRTLFRLLR